VVVSLLIIIPLAGPLLVLLWQAAAGGPLAAVMAPARLLELGRNTLLLALAVVAASLALGMATAWCTSRTDLPRARLWSTMAAVPVAIPSYVAALALLGATGQRGLLSQVLGSFGLGPMPTPRGFAAAWVVLTLISFPYVHLLLVPAMRSLDRGQEEASRGLGASRLRRLATITLPQVSNSVRSAALLVGLYVVADFGAVSLLQYDTFTRAIYLQYAGRVDRRPALVLALVLVALALILVASDRAWRRQSQANRMSRARPVAPVRLRRSQRVLATGFLLLVSVASVGLPVAILAGWWLRGMGEGRAGGSVVMELLRSVGVSGVVGVVAAAVTLPVAYLTVRYRSRAGRVVENTAWATYSLPHLTVGLAVLATGANVITPLYQTLPLLLIAYLAMFLAQALGPVQAALRRVPISLEEASRALGRSALGTLRRITLPLMIPGLAAGAGLVFLTTMKELPATLLLRPTGFETLAVRVWSATSEGFYTRGALAALVLLVVAAIPLHFFVVRDLHRAVDL
jgi:iron(III) transport system permease protein